MSTLADAVRAENAGDAALDSLQPVSLLETMTDGLAPPRWAIPNLALRGEVSVLFGSPGTGKSTLYHEALVANEEGRDFLHHLPFEEPQRFVVFDWENSVAQVSRSLVRLGLRSQPRTFHYYDAPRVVRLDDEAGRAAVRALAARHDATCLVFDNRDLAFPGTAETESGPVTSAMAATKELAVGLDVAALLISHEPKAEYASGINQLRGHTAWGSFSDQLFRLRGTGNLRRLEHVKWRSIDPLETLEVRLLRNVPENTGSLTLVGAPAATRTARREARREGDIAVVEELLAELGGNVTWGAILEAVRRRGNDWGTTRLKNALDASALISQPEGAGRPYVLS